MVVSFSDGLCEHMNLPPIASKHPLLWSHLMDSKVLGGEFHIIYCVILLPGDLKG